MDKLTRHPLLKDITLEVVVDYAVEFIRIVGSAYIEKTAKLTIVNYRGQLPCDYYEMNQVRNNQGYFRYATDSFHFSEDKPQYSDLTYKIQGNCIFTSVKDGEIEISYKAMNVDEEGYPVILDNSSYERALILYIKLQEFTTLFECGKLDYKVLANTQQQYGFAVGQAQSDIIRPTIDKMESFSNMWASLLDRDHHNTGFLHQGDKEYRRLH